MGLFPLGTTRAFALLGGILALGSLSAPRVANGQASMRVEVSADHAPALWRAFDLIPPEWKPSRKVIVREISSPAMDRLVALTSGADQHAEDNSTVDGCYQSAPEGDQAPAVISLRKGMAADEAAFVFTHEYGHFIWDEILTDADRSEFRQLWRQSKREGRLVTVYAADCDEEGFAEDVAHYLRRSSKLRRKDLPAYEFLRDLLNHS